VRHFAPCTYDQCETESSVKPSNAEVVEWHRSSATANVCGRSGAKPFIARQVVAFKARWVADWHLMRPEPLRGS
jgi:hypothetical protein